jgi:short-subunit dehydrogenase
VELHDKWALVTGASSGIGVEIARELARRGMNLVLVARREDRLDLTATELRRDHSVQVETAACDLQAPGAATKLFDRMQSSGHNISVLVNNAGFGIHGDFLDQDPEKLVGMIQLNVLAVVEMTQVFGRFMAGQGGGRILQVASIAGLAPLPSYAVYAATKSFVLNFSEAISLELQDRNVSVTVLMPGVTWTEFFEVSGQETTTYNRVFGMSSSDVAKIGVKAMVAGRASVIAGWRNWLSITLSSVFPRHVRAWLTWQMMKMR